MWAMGGGKGEHEDEWRSRMKPDNELPASVALDVVLAETPDVVISISAVEVYRNGIDLRIDVRTRGDVLAGAVGGGFIGDEVLVGVEYPDGRRATNLPMWPPRTPPAPSDAQLTMGGGSGGQRAADMRMYLTPLPPPGTIKLDLRLAAARRSRADHVHRCGTAPCRRRQGSGTVAVGALPRATPTRATRRHRQAGWFEETQRQSESS